MIRRPKYEFLALKMVGETFIASCAAALVALPCLVDKRPVKSNFSSQEDGFWKRMHLSSVLVLARQFFRFSIPIGEIRPYSRYEYVG